MSSSLSGVSYYTRCESELVIINTSNEPFEL
jgi:hypothetical protein